MADQPTIDDQIDTVTITGVPIFSAGDYPQGQFDQQFLEELARNYDPQFHEAPNYLAHEQADGSRPAGNLALGWIKHVWVTGKTLFAEMVNVPRIFAELILAGRVKKRSVEIYRNLSGRGAYLRAVAWPMIPQVKGLADIQQSQIFDDNEPQFVSLTDVEPGQNCPDISDIKPYIHVAQKEAIDMDAQQQEEQQAAESQNVTRGEIKLMLHQLKGELIKHQEQLSQASEIKVFCEQMVLAGKMTPAERDTEQPLLIAQCQREHTSSFAEGGDEKPLSRQRMDYYRCRPAFLGKLSTVGESPQARVNLPAARMFAEHRGFFEKMGLTADDLIFADKMESQDINALTYEQH